MFDPCITHQFFLNEIKDLGAILKSFFFVQSRTIGG